MPHQPSVFAALLKPLSRRAFAASVERHDGDKYDKNFSSWDHLVALIFAQLSGADSLRGVSAAWAANAHHHYHLGAAEIPRSTLSDASRRRPAAIFAEIFAHLAGLADRKTRAGGGGLVKLIDSSPIPLSSLHAMRAFNGRIKCAKMHLVYDLDADVPEAAQITPANVNDISFADEIEIAEGANYVFDKGYCSLRFWAEIHERKAFFVTRAKSNAALERVRALELDATTAAETNVVSDEIVRHQSKSTTREKLGFLMRRVTVRRDDGETMQIVTNDLVRPAREIAALYRRRWRIELLFRWIKQHLKIRRFIGRSENAVKLQILAALIAYILLRIAARSVEREDLEPIRFAERVDAALFQKKPLRDIDKPPPKRTHAAIADPNQIPLAFI